MTNPTSDRREFLTTLGAATASLVAGTLFRPAAAQTGLPPLDEVDLRDDVTLVTGAGTNVVVLRAAGVAAVVDSGPPERANDVAKLVRGNFGMLSVELLFNTHWHPAHTGGNEALRSGDTDIVAHELTRLWMSTEYYVNWEDESYTPRAAVARPTDTFRSSDPQPLTLVHGGQRIEYGHLPEAHTDGDIYVRFPDENVVVAGDVLAAGTWPVLDYATGGWIGGMQESMRILLGVADANTLLVPGEGAPLGLPALEAQREMLDTLHERIRVRMIAAKSIDEIVADNVAEGYEALGDARLFVTNVYQGLWWTGRLRGAY